jgi:hypothetical protein
MRFRKLRIAGSVGCAIACVLLIVLWVRSYSFLDMVSGQVKIIPFCITSRAGYVYFDLANDGVPWGIYSQSSKDWNGLSHVTPLVELQKRSGFGISHWLFVIAAGIFALMVENTWFRRFTLRTLLIVTTLVALVLGVIVYFSH